MVKPHLLLHEVISKLNEYPAESVIFAERVKGEFQSGSEAVVLELSEDELKRPILEIAKKRAPSMEYFLEVFIAAEMLEELQSTGANIDTIVERVIYYAENDA